MASGVYNISKGGNLNWASGGDDIDCLLVAAGYDFNPDHNYVDDITSEVSGTGYNRRNVLNRTVTENAASDALIHDCNDPVFGAINVASDVDGIVFFIYNAADASAQLVAYNQLSSPVTTNGGQLTVQISSDGVYKGLPG